MAPRKKHVSQSKAWGLMTNPLKEDPELKSLLKELESINSSKSFEKWRNSFLSRFVDFLDKKGTKTAEKAYWAFADTMSALVNVINKLDDLIEKGMIKPEKCSVKAHKSLQEFSRLLAGAIEQIEDLLPGTLAEEQRVGYTKFHMGAVLVQDGFREYGRMSMTGDAIEKMQGYLASVVDTQVIREMHRYCLKLNVFCDVMADLNLFNAMLKCRDFVQADDDEERIHIEFEDQPVEQYPPHVFGTKQKMESSSSDYPSFDKTSAKNDLGGSIASLEPDTENLMLVVSPSKKDYDLGDGGFDYQPSGALEREPSPYGTVPKVESSSLEPDNSLMLGASRPKKDEYDGDFEYQPSETLEREPAPYGSVASAEPQIEGELVLYGDSSASAPLKNPTKERETQPYSYAPEKEKPLPLVPYGSGKGAPKRGPSNKTTKGNIEREPAPYSSAKPSSLEREPAPYSSRPSSDKSSDRVRWNPNVYYGNQPSKRKKSQKQAARPLTQATAARKDAQRPAKSPPKTTTTDQNKAKSNAKVPPKVQTASNDDSSEASESSTAVSVDEAVLRKVPADKVQPALKPTAQDNTNRKSKREPEGTSEFPDAQSNNARTAEQVSKQEEHRDIPAEPKEEPTRKGIRKLFSGREPKEKSPEKASQKVDDVADDAEQIESLEDDASEDQHDIPKKKGIQSLFKREPREKPTTETSTKEESLPEASDTDNKTRQMQPMKPNNKEAPEEKQQGEGSKPEPERKGIRTLFRREPRDQHSKPTEEELESEGPDVEEDKETHQSKDSNNDEQQRSNRNLLEKKGEIKPMPEKQEKEKSKVEVKAIADDVGSGEQESGRNQVKNDSKPKNRLGLFKRNQSEDDRPERQEPSVDNDPKMVHNAGEEPDQNEDNKTHQKTQRRRSLFLREPKAQSEQEDHPEGRVPEVVANDVDANNDTRSAVEHDDTNEPTRRKGIRNLFKREHKQSNRSDIEKPQDYPHQKSTIAREKVQEDSEVEGSDDEESNEEEEQPVKRRRKWSLISFFRRKKRDSKPTDGPCGEDDSASESGSDEDVSEEAAEDDEPVEVPRRNNRSPMPYSYQPTSGVDNSDGGFISDGSSVASESTTVTDDVIEASLKETRQSEELQRRGKIEGNKQAENQPSPAKSKPTAADQAPPPPSKSEKVRSKPKEEDKSSPRSTEREKTDGDSKAVATKEKTQKQATTAKSKSTDPVPPPSIKNEKVKPKPERKEVSSPQLTEPEKTDGDSKAIAKKEKPKKQVATAKSKPKSADQVTPSSSSSIRTEESIPKEKKMKGASEPEKPDNAARVNTKPRSDEATNKGSNKISPESRRMPVDDVKVSENEVESKPFEQQAVPPKKQSNTKVPQEPAKQNHHAKEKKAASGSPDACFEVEEIKKLVQEYEQHTDGSSLQPITKEVHKETKQKHKDGKAKSKRTPMSAQDSEESLLEHSSTPPSIEEPVQQKPTQQSEKSACDSSTEKQKKKHKHKKPEKAERRLKTEKPAPPMEIASEPMKESNSLPAFTTDRDSAPYSIVSPSETTSFSKRRDREPANKPSGEGLSKELVPLPPSELLPVPPSDSLQGSFTIMDREPSPYNMGPIRYKDHTDEPSGKGMPNELVPLPPNELLSVPPIESSQSTSIRDREPAPYNMSAIGDQDEVKADLPTRDAILNVPAIDSAQSPLTMDREPAPYNMGPIRESLLVATEETHAQPEKSPAIGSGNEPPAEEEGKDTTEDEPQLSPPFLDIETDIRAKKEKAHPMAKDKEPLMPPPPEQKKGTKQEDDKIAEKVQRMPIVEDRPAKMIEKKSKKKVDKPKEEPSPPHQLPEKIGESAPKVAGPPTEEKTESTDASARKPIEKKKPKKKVDKPKGEPSAPKVSEPSEEGKETPSTNTSQKKKKPSRTTNESLPTQPLETTMEKDRSLKPPSSPKHHSEKKKGSRVVEAAKEAADPKPVPPPKPVATVEEPPKASPAPAAPPEAPAARPRRRRDEERTKEVNVELRMKCYMWYARMGQPSRDAMKRRVAKLKDCDITAEDVDELPWICGGAMLSVREMNNLISNNKAYEVPTGDKKD